MAQVVEHVTIEGRAPGHPSGHLHPNFYANSRFTNGQTSGELMFTGTSIAVYVDGRPDSHFHLDVSKELDDLVNSLEAGDLDSPGGE